MGNKLNRAIYLIGSTLVRPFFGTKVVGKENIPADGCLICPNHTTASDAISIILALGKNCDYAIMAKAELFKNRILAWLFNAVGGFPVNREGNDLNAIRLGTKALKAGKKLILFPEGTRRRDGKLGPAKAGAGMFAMRANVPIVPVYITPGKKFLRRTTVRFGEAFYPECIGEKHAEQYQNASDQIMTRIADMMKEGN
jgi:1-acyl-sn-glycerol-3-phosphate acyltransferase